MMISPNTSNIRKDVNLLGTTLLRLALPRLILRLIVLLSALAILLYCAQSILTKGRGWLEFGIHVSGLNEILGKTVIDFVMQYQKFFWWFVVFLLVLFVLSGLTSWLKSSIKSGRAALAPLGEVRKLCTGLSHDALDVLDWVWHDKSTPLTVGNLQATLSQLRSNRAGKLELARAQKRELELALTTTVQPSPEQQPQPEGQREPTLLA
jgi:hypothetical protein